MEDIMVKLGATEKMIIYLLLHRKQWICTKEILDLLGKIRISESAVRASLFRLRRNNIVKVKEQGRESLFMWSEFAQGILNSYLQRYSMSGKKWEGQWLLLSFEIPEKKRRLRNLLRDELCLHGFGRLHHNLWISPYDMRAECRKIIKRLQLEPHTMMFISAASKEETRDMVQQAWHLEELAEAYRRLQEKFEADYRTFKKARFVDATQGAVEALARLARINEEMIEFSAQDPYLPKEILPRNWAGTAFNITFSKYEKLLRRKAAPLIQLEDPLKISRT
jgi:phenylacetic acid degradation operon negative regulatory protein